MTLIHFHIFPLEFLQEYRDRGIPLSQADKDAVNDSQSIYLDVKKISRKLLESLEPYMCAYVKPDQYDSNTDFHQTRPLLLTEKELAKYDTPDTGALEPHCQTRTALACF